MHSTNKLRVGIAGLALAAFAAAATPASAADIVLPGDVNNLGDVQTVVVGPEEGDFTCSLSVTQPYSERSPDGNFRTAGDAVGACAQGAAVFMDVRAELHQYSSATASSGSTFGSPGGATAGSGTTLRVHTYGNVSGPRYVRTIGQARFTFYRNKIPSNFVMSSGCYKAQSNQVICNAASKAVTAGPSGLPASE